MVARQKKRQGAQDIMQEDSPKRPASRPSDEGVGEVPQVVYEPEDPMDVGSTPGYGIQAPYAYLMYIFALLT